MQVTLKIKTENLEAFLVASLENARASRMEPGNIRFDILQSADEPSQITLYEAYADKAAMEAHFDTPHFAAWRESTGDMIAQSSGGTSFTLILPDS